MARQYSPKPGSARYFAFPRTAGAIAELDGLRAIAIILVLGRHAVWPVHQGGQGLLAIGDWDLVTLFLNGWIGVDLFFVLSGFLITHHILRRSGRRSMIKFGPYLAARALRIVPAYLAVIALVVAGAVPLYQLQPEHLSLRLLYHLMFLQDYFPSNIVVPFWSLGVEEKFYLVAPFIVLAAARCRTPVGRYGFLAGLVLLPAVLRVVTGLQVPGITDYGSYFPVFRSPFHLSLDSLAAGVCCAFIYRDRAQHTGSRTPGWPAPLFWLSMLALLVQLFAVELLGRIGWYQIALQPLVLALTFGGLLLSAACGGTRGDLLRCRPFLIVARISYPLYLIHITFVPLALAWSGYAAGAGLGHFLLYLGGYLLLSLTAAFVLHFSVEKPFLLVKDLMGQTRLDKVRAAT